MTDFITTHINNMPDLTQHIILEFLGYKLRNRRYIKQIQDNRRNTLECLLFDTNECLELYYREEEIQYRYIYFWMSNRLYHNCSIDKYIVFKQSVYDTNDFSVFNEYFDIDFDGRKYPFEPTIPW